MVLEIGDVVLCTVDRIVGTTVFVHIEGNGEGSLVFSEVAPGRIRNIRDYIVPKKQIVCKVLRISGNHIDLSLRRVSQKERKEVKEKFKQEKSLKSILKKILGNQAEETIEKISKKEDFYSFFQEAKNSPKELEKLVGKEKAKKIIEILQNQKKKRAIIKKEISLKTEDPEGLDLIKKILGKIKDIEIRYISAGRYSLKKESEDIKEADQEIRNILENLEKAARKNSLDFSIVKK
jgi:translation initiation factor 2 alpha subunit (eIF-2alpha)